MEHPSADIASLKERLSTEFQRLPDYAAYLLHHQFDDFVKGLLGFYREAEIPLLRFFKDISHDQMSAMIAASNRELLTFMASNQVRRYIDQTLDNWLKNQLPVIKREQIHSNDITLVNFARARAFRHFIPDYTDDLNTFRDLANEIDRFFLILNSELFTAYIELQQAEINSINKALEKREKQRRRLHPHG